MQNEPSTQEGYYAMIRSDNPKFALRKALAAYAMEHGIKPAMRHFACARKTARKWLRRYKAQGHEGLKELSRAPKSCPHKTPPGVEALVVAQRLKTPGFGAKRLVMEFDLPVGASAAHRILKQRGLVRQRRRRHQRKNDLRAVKAAYAPFTRFQMDTKHLCDLPRYWPQMNAFQLPRYQYTIRELSTGAHFVAYSNELTKTYATMTARRFLEHLRACGLDTAQALIQTDLGTEFDGDTVHYMEGGFHRSIEDAPFHAGHHFNPPACPNANADVESAHATIEGEFFEAETFRSRAEFLGKITTYQHWFNLARKNRSRGWRAPADILREKAPQLSPKIFLLPPVALETLLPATRSPPPSGGHDLPRSPDNRITFTLTPIIRK